MTLSDFEALLALIKDDRQLECSMGPLKEAPRVEQKRDDDYAGNVLRVVDLVRASGICSYEQLHQLPTELVADFGRGGKYSDTWELVRTKDGFIDANNFLAGGYRDWKLLLRCKRNGHVCELQLHAQPFYDIKHNGGHAHYTFSRALKVEGITSAVSILYGLKDEVFAQVLTYTV